jgi:acid phosphatase type 7
MNAHLRRLALALTSWLLLASTAEASLTVYAAGDIAECNDGAANSAAAQTARLVTEGAPVIVLGDAVYKFATHDQLVGCYGPTWGRFLATTYAVPGNHDYVDGSVADFLGYFGERNGKRTWFRAPLGQSWWLIGLDSSLSTEGLREQKAWLDRELATIKGDGRCLIAAWHHATFSTGLHRGDGDGMKAAWKALDAAGADLVLSGHEHFYESFEPLDAGRHPKPVGIREFVVGTGGATLKDLSFSTGHRVFAREHGVLELDLDPDRYRWTFHTVKGTTPDRGEASCRNASVALKAPTHDAKHSAGP